MGVFGGKWLSGQRVIFRKEQIAEEFDNPHINISRDKTQVSESKTSPEEL